MGISVENFMAGQTEKGRQSKLDPYQDDILLLKKNGFSQKQIQQFLVQNGVHAGLTTINWFIRTRSQNASPVKDTATKKTDSVNQLTDNSGNIFETKKQSIPVEQADTSQPRQFNWTDSPNDEELFGKNTDEQPEN